MRFGALTDRGMKREINEDSYIIIAGYPGVPVSYVIADGLGGHNAGEIASRIAVDFVSGYIMQYSENLREESRILPIIQDMMEKANDEVYKVSQEKYENHGMGTTLTIAVVYGGKLFIGHVGDCRLYVVGNEGMKRITNDHSYIEELIREGSLTREEAIRHPKKNLITRALGCAAAVEIDTYSYIINQNDVFLMCTDGLTNMLDEEEIKQTIIRSDNPQQVCNELVKKANEKGGADNITVIVFKGN